jgi:hypothetical protein
MSKKQDGSIGIVILVAVILGAAINFVNNHPKLTLLILAVIALVIFYIFHKSRQVENKTTINSVDYSPNIVKKEIVTFEIDITPVPSPRFWSKINFDLPVNCKLKIDYTNAKSEQSSREIDVKEIDGTVYFRGGCYLRGEYRTFRADRVNNCIDRETGEVIHDIQSYLLQKHELQKLYDNEKNILRCLCYIGKADGQLRDGERAIIHRACRNLANNQDLLAHDLDLIINRIEVPSLYAFKLAIAKVYNKSPKIFEAVKELSEEIVNTQQAIHPSKQEALDYINKKAQIGEKLCP